ncbi:hypothetical protein GOP47_0005823 [Adiantum capillus-veneris]|uniref:Pentatricopeptide repeat-containing protein n=1 Tax=Adiantum capillus-veneris TaxID=13818 RepID=A0A9D4V6A4_ADICA|nr:hypothetical protein GOP47_0005823 [Adiantum capillus-veneris]
MQACRGMELLNIPQSPSDICLVSIRPPSSTARQSPQTPRNVRNDPEVRSAAMGHEDLSIHHSLNTREAVITIASTSNCIPLSWAKKSLEDALSLLDSHSLPHPTVYEFACILRKCRKAQNPAFLPRLLAHIRTLGHESDPHLGNNLVSALVEAGHLSEAQQVFENLEAQNRPSCNSLITGYVKCGQPLLALSLYERLTPDELLRLSGHTFVALIKACTKSKNLELGSQIHACVKIKGLLQRDKFLGSVLVDMYAKCGSLAKAQELFNELPVKDVVSWNALISAYANHGLGEKALQCFSQMQHEGFTPTSITFVCCLKACGSLRDTDQCQTLDVEVTKHGLEKDLIVGSALLDMHVKCGSLKKAEEVFHNLPVRNVVSWTALIKGYVEHGFAEEALSYFEKMQEEGISPDVVAFLCVLKACGKLGSAIKGEKLHADISRIGLEKDLFLGCALVDMYCVFGLLDKAQEIFNKLITKDVMLWNTLMGGFVDHGKGKEALQCYQQMQQDGICPSAVSFVYALKACGSLMNIEKGREIHAEISNRRLDKDMLVGSSLVDMYSKCGALELAQEVFDNLSAYDVVSWTSLIGGYTNLGQGREALTRFEMMQHEGLSPNAITFACSLKACGIEGALHKGQEIHAKIAKAGLLEGESILGNALIDMYAKCGLAIKAQEVFELQVIQDVVAWNALIAGYAQLGESKSVLCMLNKMVEQNETPNLITFVSVLNACSHAGLIDLGLMYFDIMVKEYGINPLLEHHTCMIDLLCRAGQVENALCMINEMRIDPDLAVWHTLLGACQKGGDKELGKQAFEQAVYRNGLDATAYVSWSNIFHDDDVV